MILNLNLQEANTLVELMNEAVKAKGLAVANDALFFVKKLQEANFEDNIKKATKEDPPKENPPKENNG